MTAALKGESNHAKSMKFHQPEDTTKSGTRPSRHRSRRLDLARFARLGIGPELLIEARVCRVTDSEAARIMASPARVTWQEAALEQAQSRLDGFSAERLRL